MAKFDQKILKKLGTVLLSDLRDRIPSATGKTARAARLEVEPGEFSILVPLHFQTLITGRGPTTQSGGGDQPLYDSILKWIKARGVVARVGKDGKTPTQEALAFMITRKIHREGTVRYRLKRESNLLKGWITNKKIGDMKKAVIDEYEPEVQSDIIKRFKQAVK